MKTNIFKIILSSMLYSTVAFLCLLNALIANNAGSSTISETGYYSPSEALVTPHIQWLKPYYKGKIKALIIVPRTSMRDVIELAQRMDLDYNVFVTESAKALAGKEKTPETDLASRQNALDNTLRGDYDVIIIGNCNWDLFPANYASSIISKVKSGTGLVGVINNPSQEITSAVSAGVPSDSRTEFTGLMAGFPFLQASDKNGGLVYSSKSPDELVSNLANVGKLGNGKVCLFTYTPKRMHALIPGPAGAIIGRDQTGIDYQMAAVIRGILWASNHLPDISIAPSSPAAMLKFEDTSNRKMDFAINNSKTPIAINTDSFIINSEGVTVSEKKGTANIVSGMNTLSFDVPVLPVGKYRLNVIIGQSDGLINFATGLVTISGNSSISGISLDKTSFLKTDQPSGKVIVSNPASGMKIRLSDYDNYDRLVDQKVLTAASQTAFTFNSPGSNQTVINYVRAELLSSDGTVIDSEKAYYTISNVRPVNDDLRVVMWSRTIKEDRYYTPWVLKYWKDSGIDTVYSAFSEHSPLANMNGIPIINRFADEKTSSEFASKVPQRTNDDLIRQPCLTDSAYLTELDKTLTDGANLWKDYSVSELSLGDECNFCDKDFDLCFSPTCIADFKRFVSTQYSSISDLNNEYGTDYKSFNDVNPLPIESARQQKQISIWVDHRLHMDSVWAGIYQHARDVIKKVVPDAVTGYEGSDTFATTWRADDYLQLIQSMNFNNIYYRPFQSAAWGSRFAEGNLLGLGWFGGYTAQLALKHDYNTIMTPWRTIFEGANSLWIWQSYPGTGSVSAPDFTFYGLFKDALDTIKELKSGVGKALITANRQTDAGIYYSPASIHTEEFLNGKVDCNAGYQTAALLVRSLSYQPKVYGIQDTADGLLTKDKPKVLIMPNIQSLSSAEADSIRQYVKNGGFLIADVNPGVRDSHGKLLNGGSLDDVFGVKLHGDEPLSSEVPSITSSNSAKLPSLLCGRSTELKGGTANGNAGNAPVVILNSFGSGKAILLNFAIDKIGEDDLKSLSSMINKLMSDSGVYPALRLTDAITMGLETNCFTSGGIQYVCLMQDWAGDKASDIPVDRQMSKTKLQIPAKSYIYNIRNATYIGYATDTDVSIKPLDPVILALVPYKISGVKLNLNTNSPKQGDVLQYTASITAEGGSQPDPQVVRIRLTDPSGKDVSYYDANLLVKGSSAGKLELALNEAPGKWTITATDIISGLSTNANFTVSSR